MKSRKVRKTQKRKAIMTKKMAKGNIPLDTHSDKDSDADAEKNLFSDQEEVSTDDEGLFYRKDDSSEEEEVLPITDDEKDDEDEEGADDADEDSEDDEQGLPNREAWGKKKSTYYNADFVDQDRGKSYREKDSDRAKQEEEEALLMQKDQMSYFAGEMPELDLEELPNEEQVAVDPKTLDNAGKLKYLKKKYPHMLSFIKELNEKLSEINEKILPLLELAKVGAIENENGSLYVKMKYQLLMHYCMNLSFYMHLVAKGLDATNHPVVGRINEFKALIDKTNFEKVNQEIAFVAAKIKNNEEVILLADQSPKTVQKSKKIPRINENEESDEDHEMEDIDIDGNQETVDGKRKITYQIAKNKGLTAKKRKELRNPRVKHRMKFKKAKVRRKGQVREVIREVKRYEGEPTGISTHVVKSIKIK